MADFVADGRKVFVLGRELDGNRQVLIVEEYETYSVYEDETAYDDQTAQFPYEV